MSSSAEVVGIVSVVGIIAWTVRGVVEAVMRRVDTRKASASLPPMMDDRLARIEQAVDAIAVEVERVSEAQRFTTRLLSERADPGRALPRPPGTTS